MELIKEEVKQAKQTKDTCCPVFHPESWDGKTVEWNRKKFIKATIPIFFHMPLPAMISNRVTKMMKLAEDAKALSENPEDILLLFIDPNAFKSEIYLSVIDIVPGAINTELSGTFRARVFDGPFNAAPKFMKQMDTDLENQEKKAKNYYVHYAYCPKCAKETGHNYMVLFAELTED
ncbi:hypothetical protein FK220_010135 [Flavobacteriaceae bacterium TP-CH-4]|uniref:Uncharacterized protein n=1 Tax=Pelagihabitans pacificus TaxID=2696054 RepID=A0A967EAS2_9FLAO|nr:hydrolase [Pelagihabitans pacificus]NHF59701.1 hypothetical protein [Pelagihabitans pacificus]